jgi:hypothetical protein
VFGLHTSAVVWVAGGIIVYAIVTRGLFRVTNGLRMSLIDLAAELIQSPDVPEAKKELIRAGLDDVHSARSAWIMTILFPLAALSFPFVRRRSDLSSRLPGKLQGTFEAFMNRWAISTISNSVFATLIFTTMLVIVSAFVSSIYPIALLVMRRQGSLHGHAHA